MIFYSLTRYKPQQDRLLRKFFLFTNLSRTTNYHKDSSKFQKKEIKVKTKKIWNAKDKRNERKKVKKIEIKINNSKSIKINVTQSFLDEQRELENPNRGRSRGRGLQYKVERRNYLIFCVNE